MSERERRRGSRGKSKEGMRDGGGDRSRLGTDERKGERILKSFSKLI